MSTDDEKDDEQSEDTAGQQELTEEDLEAVQGGAKKDPELEFKEEDYMKVE
jgi:bacteriocin-like protein